MAKPDFTPIVLSTHLKIHSLNGSFMVRSSLIVSKGRSPRVLTQPEATWRRRCDEAELGKTGEVVKRDVSRTRPWAWPKSGFEILDLSKWTLMDA